jgi:hypothetical protein
VALLLDEVQRPSGSPTVRKGFGSVQSVLPRTDFDWDVCLGTNRVQANWVLTAITLAQEVLGAGLPEVRGQKTEVRRQRTESALFKLERQELPRWLVPAVLKQWGGRVQLPSRSPTVREGFGSAPGSINSQRALPNVRASAWSSLYQRWDNPIRATAAVGGRFNNWPRLPYRLAESMMRVTELWKAEGRGQRTEGRGQRAEGRGQRAEGRGQRPGIRSWRLARGRNF